jgi:L-ascorbate metabolism protein UlaG (beta-lactamase superfamily)
VRVEGGMLRVTFVNHTTVLLQTQGLNILTDPIWSERCGPVSWLGPRRVRPPGIRFEDLPPIDVVLLSHNHYDHCDLRTLKRLARTNAPRLIAPLGNRRFLERRGIPVLAEPDWWDAVAIAPGIVVTAVPARHFSGRGLFDRDRSLWAGFVIGTPSGSISFAADTGFGDHFALIRERLGEPRLALLPIGAFRPEWFMSRVHMSPEQAVEAHRLLGARTTVATHFGTFQLADDGELEAPQRIARALDADPSLRFWVLGFGEGREVPP